MPTDLPDVARVTLEGAFNGEPFVNVLHFKQRSGTPLVTADLTALLSILDDAATDADSWMHIWQTMDSGAVITSMTARSLSNASPLEVSSSVTLAGTSAGTDLPPMLSVMVKWQGAFANRTSRGRTYLTGLNTGFVSTTDADRVDAGVITNLQTRSSAFVAAWKASVSWTFIVLSQKQREANLATPYSEVGSSSVDSLIRLQRRRRAAAS